MTAEACIKLLREIKDVAFATVDEEGHPQVRIIDVMIAEGEKLYFCTERGKDFYRQLMSNEYTAITISDQKMWIDRIFEENPMMNDVYPGESRYISEAFCIEDGLLEFFDLGNIPIYRERFTIGKIKKEEKGFWITEACIGCGTCRDVCPQKCISEGKPYKIQREHCLHCGLCEEQCPAGAIQRKDG